MSTALEHQLNAISPLDGRYGSKTEDLWPFSEGGLIHYRALVELLYLRALCKALGYTFSDTQECALTGIEEQLDLGFAVRVKAAEATTNHDVKAVEIAIGERFRGTALQPLIPWIHLGLTSEDTNNIAYALQLREGVKVILSYLDRLNRYLQDFAHEFAELPMLARTHGQPATPTTFGKEIAVFAYRLERQIEQLRTFTLLVKLGGASGNLNAHKFIDFEINWLDFSRTFVTTAFPDYVLPFEYNPLTTQIEPHDTYAELFHILHRISSILIDFSQDTWRYISDGYLKLKVVEDEVGSSTMPHKVNPINFENTEGNLNMVIALAEMFSRKLPVARLQRDLSDSTVIRNFGVAFGHLSVALQNLLLGMDRIVPNHAAIRAALAEEWELLAEPIQVAMRRYGCDEDAYMQLKELTRGKVVTREMLREFISKLELPEELKQRLLALTPETYLGYAARLARGF